MFFSHEVLVPDVKGRGRERAAADFPLSCAVHTLQLLRNHLVPLQDSKNSTQLCACAIFSSCNLKRKKEAAGWGCVCVCVRVLLLHKDTTCMCMCIFCVNGHTVPPLFRDARCCIGDGQNYKTSRLFQTNGLLIADFCMYFYIECVVIRWTLCNYSRLLELVLIGMQLKIIFILKFLINPLMYKTWKMFFFCLFCQTNGSKLKDSSREMIKKSTNFNILITEPI